MEDIQTTLNEWTKSNKRLALLHLLIDEAKKLHRSSEEDEEKISNFTRTAKAYAERDMLWKLYFTNKKELELKINEILL